MLLQLKEALAAGDYVLDLNDSLGEVEVDQAIAFTSSGEEVTRIGRLHGIEPLGSTIRLDVSSKGTARVHLEGQYAIWPANTFPGAESTEPFEGIGETGFEPPDAVLEAGLLPAEPVMPGDRRRVPLELRQALPPGDWVLDLNGRLGRVSLNVAVPFTIEEPEAPTSSP